MAGRMAGQTINDRLLAARHSLAGQGLAKAVCKATTEEMIGPKKKHLEYLVHCTNEPNVSIPQLANLLIERSQNTNWIVVYKALITVHHMMCYGNERFTQYLASSNCTFQLSNFLDKSGVQGYDMSPFVRRYSKYLNEKAMAYRTLAFDFCKARRGKDDGVLRTMNADKLLKVLPVLQSQLDALLEFDCSSTELSNGVINMCFVLLFKDLIRLFAGYNDGIINLLEKYFDMNKKQCKEALDIYKKFLVRMDKVRDFLKVAENIGMDKGDIPDLTKAPSSLLDALEQHLIHFDGKKNPTTTTTTNNNNASINNHSNVTNNGINKKSSKSSTDGQNGRLNSHGTTIANGMDETVKLQLLAEEEAAINQFKSKLPPLVNNPFISPSDSTPSKSSSSTVNFFDSNANVNSKASDDLLQLSNPFIDNSFDQSNDLNQPHTATNGAWIMSNGNGVTSNPILNGGFVNESNFMTAFGNSDSRSINLSNFDALGGVLQPMSTGSSVMSNGQNDSTRSFTVGPGSQIPPENGHEQKTSLLSGDLEASLASLAENLTINTRTVPVKGVQWNSPKGVSKSSHWSPQSMSDTTIGANYKPMNQAIANNNTFIPPNSSGVLQPQIRMFTQHPMGVHQMASTASISLMNSPSVNQMGRPPLLFH